MIGLGIAAAVVLWLVFSVLRRVFALLILGAIAIGGWMLWNNPEMLRSVTALAQRFMGT